MMLSPLKRLAGRRLRRLERDIRGVIAVLTALLLPMFLIVMSLIVDVGFWLIDSTRLQIAADAAAMVAATMMLTSAYQGEASATQITNAINVAIAGAELGANQLTGTITPSVTIDGPNYTTATVTLTYAESTVFAKAVGLSAPTLKATASATIAPRSCVLALTTSGTGISVGSGSTFKGTNNCPIFSNSNITTSGTLSGYTIGAAGTITGTTTPATNSPGRPVQTDYFAGTPAPAYAAAPTCTSGYNGIAPATIPASTTAAPITFCGQVRYNTSTAPTVTFGGGIYYIYSTSTNQGFIAIDGSTVKFSAPTTFVLVGSNAVFYLYDGATISASSPLTAPTSGATAGFTIWQPCTSSGAVNSYGLQIGNGTNTASTTATISGAIYTPCNPVQVTNATVAPPSGSGLAIVANSISVSVGAGANTSLTATATQAILTTPVLSN
jgi:Flp pilus assembly protein TadG